jgi:hypothetical protein
VTKLTVTVGTFYIATTGTDTTCAAAQVLGTAARTLAFVGTCAGGGSTIYYRAGTYTEIVDDTALTILGGSSWSAPTTLSAMPSEVVTWAPSLGSSQSALSLANSSSLYLLVQNITINGGTGLHAVLLQNPANHLRLQNLTIIGGQNAIVHVAANDVDVWNNTIHSNTVAWGCVRITGAARATVKHNDISDCRSGGIDDYADTGTNTNTLLDGNRIHDTHTGESEAGIVSGQGSGLLAMNNLIYNFGRCLRLDTNSASARVANNTCYNTTQAVQPGLTVASPVTGANVQNNIWYQPGGVSDASSGGVTYAANLCQTADPTHCAVVGNPLFTNAAAGDFSLQSGSPAFNTGVTVAQVTTDFTGTVTRPQGLAYDIGAYEYVVPTLPPPTEIRLVPPWQSGSLFRR